MDMNDSISTTTGLQRPRVRRALGVAVGVALATPFAFAPAAQAQGVDSRVGPDLLSQIVTLVQNILGGLGYTLQNPLGQQAPNAEPRPCQPAGIAELLSCVIAPLQAPLDPSAKAKVKAKARATLRSGKVTSLRWVK
jgi:hypothetical protein